MANDAESYLEEWRSIYVGTARRRGSSIGVHPAQGGLYLAGLAEVAADEIDILTDGYAYGSLSMTSYTLGLAHSGDSDIVRCEPPPPPSLPPDESNI